MPLPNLPLLSLKNRLRSLQLPAIELATAPFSMPSDPVLLEISAQGSEFVLAVAQTPALFALPQLRPQQQALQGFNVPPIILSAFLELYLQLPLKKVAQALETTILVTSYGSNFNPDKFAFCLSFYLQTDGLHLPLMLYSKNKDALYNLLQKLDEIYLVQQQQLQQQQQQPNAARANHEEGALTEILRVIIGYSLITPKEFASLEIGDALMVEQLCLNNDHLVVSFANFLAHATINSSKVTLESDFTWRVPLYQYLPKSMEGAMSDNPRLNPNGGPRLASTLANGNTAKGTTPLGAGAGGGGGGAEAGGSNAGGNDISLHDLDELPLEVNFVLERQLMTFETLKQLKTGSQIVLTNHDLSNITLEINGQAVATGRLIDLGERFALQILKKGK